MTTEVVLSNAKIVTEHAVLEGSVVISEGAVVEVRPTGGPSRAALDLEGDLLLPGFVDVHTDHLEKVAAPRDGVAWEPLAAVLTYDMTLTGAGITTAFDSLVVGAVGRPWRRALLASSLEELRKARAAGLLRGQHALHLRCDLLERGIVETVLRLLDETAPRFVTLLDDSPERDPARAARGHEKRRGLPAGALRWPFDPLPEEEFEGALERREAIVRACQARGVPCANHDDFTASQVRQAASLGLGIAEFPLSREAAEAARATGMAIIAGAPNVVLGRSHGGNVSVRELAAAGLVDVLCSDYVPGSLLLAAFGLHAAGMVLPEAVGLVSARPARLFGYADRGRVAPGCRADLVRVALHGGRPVVRQVWVGGRCMIGAP